MASLDKAEVTVIGGGVSGLSTAWWLARNGIDVVLLEKSIVGWEASGRNGGGIGHIGGIPGTDGLAHTEVALWPKMDELLGYPTEWTQSGFARMAMSERELISLLSMLDHVRLVGGDHEWIDGDTFREWVPMASDQVLGGLYTPTAGHANPQRTSQAYAWALQDLGGRIHQNTTVTGIDVVAEKATRVLTGRGDVETDFVVCAAGPQTGLVAEMAGAYVPVSPGRVEIIVTAPLPPAWPGMIVASGLYGRQTARGNLAYGGGNQEWIDVELHSPEKPNTPLIRNVARRLAELYPGVEDVPVLRSWGGVVEQTPDYTPIIDFVGQPANMIVITMSGDGFGLSPATGKAASDLVLHGETTIDIGGLRMGRFADMKPGWREERGWVPQPE